MIWALIPNPIKRALAWLLAGLAALWAIRAGAKREVRQQTVLEAAEAYAKTRKAIDDAETGIGASDSERIKRLSDFAAKR
jgi:hypothetical protein